MISDPHIAHAVHFYFEGGALMLGAFLYRRAKRRAGEGSLLATPNFAVLVGCLAGAALGNKGVFWLQRGDLWDVLRNNPWMYFTGGQSIVGGLVGALVGIELAKLAIGSTKSTGDLFVVPVLAATMFGRIGCFLAGLHDETYGIATTLPWGVDFGDGVRRHPTQLYEIVFCGLLLAALLSQQKSLARMPGLQFKLMLAGYLVWRLAVDSLKPVPYAYFGGLSGIQVVCAAALAVYLPFVVRDLWRLRRVAQEPPVPLL